MQQYPFLRLYAWSTEDKNHTNIVTAGGPVTVFTSIDLVQNISAPGTIQFSCIIADPDSTGLNKGHYFEVYAGKNQNPANDYVTSGGFDQPGSNGVPWASGYVQTIDKNPGNQAQFDITAATAMLHLSSFTELDDMEMDATTDDPNKKGYNLGYKNIMDALNGLAGKYGNPPASQGVPPGQKGMLTGSGWTAQYTDGAGMTKYTNKDGSIDPTKLPGHGDSWFTAWETALKNLQTLASHYNLYFREAPGSTGSKGVIEIGPLRDAAKSAEGTPLTIWGGEPLRTQLSTTAGADPNAHDAQMLQMAVIAGVTYEDSFANVANTTFPIGQGKTPFVNIASFFPPITDKNGHINSSDASPAGLHDYYYKYQPNPQNGGRVYWKLRGTGTAPIQVGNRKYWGKVSAWETSNLWASDLATYQLIVAETNTKGLWSYGVMNEYSVNLYGMRLINTVDKHITVPGLLLSAAIGNITNNAEPSPSWTFTVRHPMTSTTGVPTRVRPGQTIDIRYEGDIQHWVEVHADGTIATGPKMTYLRWPSPADIKNINGTDRTKYPVINGITMDPYTFYRMSMVAKVEEQWTNQGFVATYTMGQGRFRGKHWNDHIAALFEKEQTSPRTSKPSRHIKHHTLDHIPFIFEYGAATDKTNGQMVLPVGAATAADPGGIIVSDVRKDTVFIDDHHSVTFSFKLERDDQILDFWFAKPTTSSLEDFDVHNEDSYGIVRFPGVKSGQHGGFFVKNPHATNGSQPPVSVGHITANRLKLGFTANKNYTATVQWSGGTYHVHVKYYENPKDRHAVNRQYAVWHDTNQHITQWGAIGWHGIGLHGGAANIWSLAAHPLAHKHTAQPSDSGGGPVGKPPRHDLVVQAQKSGTGGVNEGGHAVRFYEYDDASEGMMSKNYLAHAVRGEETHTKGDLKKSSHLDIEIPLPSSIAANATSINLNYLFNPQYQKNGLPPNTIKSGYILYIHDFDTTTDTGIPAFSTTADKHEQLSVQVTDRDKDAQGWITSLTLTTPTTYAHNAYALDQWGNSTGARLRWDHLEHPNSAAHRIKTSYRKDTKERTGWWKLLMTGEMEDHEIEKAVAIAPDGSLVVKGKYLTDARGDVFNITQLSVGLEHVVQGFEGKGIVLFDGGEYDSRSQRALIYNDATPGAGPVKQITTANANMHNGTGPSGIEASWIQQTPGGIAPVGPYFLQLTGMANENVIVWQDNFILDDPDPKVTSATAGYNQGWDGKWEKVRRYKVTHDEGIHLAVYIDAATVGTATRTGGQSVTIDGGALAGDAKLLVKEPIDALHLTLSNPFDTWVINPGGSNQEAITSTGSSTSDNSIQIQGTLTKNHDSDEKVLMATFNGTTVQSGSYAGDQRQADDKQIGIDAIAIGALDVNGNWYRGWWGNPAWVAPYKNDTTANVFSTGTVLNTQTAGNYIPTPYVASVTASANIATVTLNQFPGWIATGVGINVQGFTPSAYNGVHTIASVNSTAKQFTYSIGSTPATATTIGTIYSQVGEMSYLGILGGSLNVTAGEPFDLHCKASHLGLYEPGQSPITVCGFEIALHVTNAQAPATIFIDTVESGHTNSKGKQSAGNVGPSDIAPGSVGSKHVNPKHTSSGHINSDLYMWAEKDKTGVGHGDNKYYIHWEHDTGPGTGPGQIITHAGQSQTYTVYAGPPADGTTGGASELHPNNGILAVPVSNVGLELIDSTNPANVVGNYLVFNSNSTGYWVNDPGVTGGKSWIPGYLVGSSSQETQGFAVVTEKFDWSKPKSGNTAVLQGPHEDLFQIAKIGKNPDPHTGEYPLLGNQKHTKQQGKQARKGSHGRIHEHPHKHGTGHFVNTTFKTTGGSSSVVATAANTVLKLSPHTSGQTMKFVPESGDNYKSQGYESLGTVLKTIISGVATTGSAPWFGTWPIGSGAAGAIVLYSDEVLNSGLTQPTWATAAPGEDLRDNKWAPWMKVGHISDGPDAGTGNFVWHGYHTGSSEVHANHVQGDAVKSSHVTAGHVHSTHVPSGHVHSTHVPAGHVHSTHVPSGHVHSTHVPAGHVHSTHVPAGHVHSTHVPAGHVHSTHVPAGHVQSSHVSPGHIHSTHVPGGHVHSTHVPAGHVQNTHVAAGHIHSTHVPGGHVQYSHVAAGHIHSTHVPGGHVQNTHVAAGHIHSTHVPGGHVQYSHVAAGHIHSTHVPGGHVQYSHVAAGHIHSTHVPGGHVQASHVAQSNIQYTHIQQGHVLNTHIGQGHVQNTHVAAGHIQNTHVAAGHIQNTHVAAGHIQNTHIAAGHVLSTHIPAAQLMNTHIVAGHVQSTHIPAGHIQNNHILDAAVTSSKVSKTDGGGGFILLGQQNASISTASSSNYASFPTYVNIGCKSLSGHHSLHIAISDTANEIPYNSNAVGAVTPITLWGSQAAPDATDSSPGNQARILNAAVYDGAGRGTGSGSIITSQVHLRGNETVDVAFYYMINNPCTLTIYIYASESVG